MNEYAVFFDDHWYDKAPLYAIVYPPSVDLLGRPVKTEGIAIRVIEGRPNANYAAERGINLLVGTKTLSLLVSELPATWKPAPGATLRFRERDWRIHQDVPPEPLAPDGSILKLTVHPI